MTEYSPAKTEEYPRIFPNCQYCACCEKDLKDNKHGSLHLGRKYARIFVPGHDLFLEAHSFPRATLTENCSLLGTDEVRGQISEHIFAPNGGYYLYIPQFSKPPGLRKYLKDSKHNSLHLARKYARIFVLGLYLILEAYSSVYCSLFGTDNVRGPISEHDFAQNGTIDKLIKMVYFESGNEM